MTVFTHHSYFLYLSLYSIFNHLYVIIILYFYGLFILPVKFTQNRQNKQRYFYSTGTIVRRLSKSIVGWNIHMARCRKPKNLFWIVCTARRSQCSASDPVIQRLTPQKYYNAFKNKVYTCIAYHVVKFAMT